MGRVQRRKNMEKGVNKSSLKVDKEELRKSPFLGECALWTESYEMNLLGYY